MKVDRPGIALAILFLVVGMVGEYGVQQAAATVFLVLVSLMLYRMFSRGIN